jgi:hypothetical protein
MVALTPNRTPGESEFFSHGPGLRPKHLENALPSEGGRYRGTTPEMNVGQERAS